MPGTITLGHIHVIHVNGHPYICSSIGDLVIHMLINQEIIGTCLTILDIIDTRLLDRREVELYIIILEVRTPVLGIPCESLLRGAILLDTHQRGCSLWLVILVELDHSHLRLIRNISHLRETDIRLTDPIRNSMRFNSPCNHLTRLSLR